VPLTPVCSRTRRQDSWIFFSCSEVKILKVEVREKERIASDIGGSLLRADVGGERTPGLGRCGSAGLNAVQP
jgi:hypothetical protein